MLINTDDFYDKVHGIKMKIHADSKVVVLRQHIFGQKYYTISHYHNFYTFIS